jgi:enoyl-CoA hydratase/carnithine racemase
MMGDVVLACPEANFADLAHFYSRDIVPGDGAHTVWAQRLGISRASYYHLTGAILSAEDAERFGAVHEIHPRELLMERARAIAANIGARPAPVLAYTRSALRMEERRHFAETVSHGMAVQGLALYATGKRPPDETE